jgi:hypothetical protein
MLLINIQFLIRTCRWEFQKNATRLLGTSENAACQKTLTLKLNEFFYCKKIPMQYKVNYVHSLKVKEKRIR